MARHYSTKDFFRQMPNALLVRYFQGRGLFGDLDFAAMKEGKPDALFAAWLALPDAQRNEMDAELLDIFTLCCEKGFLAILDEARWQLREKPEEITPLVEKLSALPNHFERAMVTFLDHKEFWKGATRFYHADTLSYWRKRKNLPHRTAAVDDASIQQFAEGLGFTKAQAKRRILELAKLLPAAARKLQSDSGHSFGGNPVVEQINTLIEQRCALTIRSFTDPAAENNAAAEPSV